MIYHRISYYGVRFLVSCLSFCLCVRLHLCSKLDQITLSCKGRYFLDLTYIPYHIGFDGPPSSSFLWFVVRML